MRGVSGVLACAALVWAVVTATSVLAQTPAPGPAAVPVAALVHGHLHAVPGGPPPQARRAVRFGRRQA